MSLITTLRTYISDSRCVQRSIKKCLLKPN